MAGELAPDVVMEYKEAFSLFDKDGDGQITGQEFATVIRSMGVNPTNKELEDMTAETGGMSGKMDFNQFVAIMCKKMRQEDSEEDLINAFLVFDKENSGKISAVELKHVMTTLGEILSDQEVDEMIRAGDASDGQIDYRAFAKKMFSK